MSELVLYSIKHNRKQQQAELPSPGVITFDLSTLAAVESKGCKKRAEQLKFPRLALATIYNAISLSRPSADHGEKEFGYQAVMQMRKIGYKQQEPLPGVERLLHSEEKSLADFAQKSRDARIPL